MQKYILTEQIQYGDICMKYDFGNLLPILFVTLK